MKELEQHNKIDESTRIEVTLKKRQEIEHMYKGSIKPKKGQFVWEIDEETGEIKKAEYKKQPAIFDLTKSFKPKLELIMRKDCVYIPALNAENAKKKYLQNNNQSHYYTMDGDYMQLPPKPTKPLW